MELKEEKHIIERILDGEQERYEYFLQKYSAQVFNLIIQIAGNREDAEELTQDVFLKAYQKLHTFRGKSSFSTWLYAIAYHAAISYTRQRNYDVCVCDERQMSALSDTVVDEALDDDSEERIRLLQAAVARLEPADRLVITLFYREEKSLQEVARIVGTTPGTLKVRLHRIRKKICLLMKNEEERL